MGHGIARIGLLFWLAAFVPLAASAVVHSSTRCFATATAAESQPLFEDGQDAVTFVLKDSQGNTPRLVLFGAPDQAETADSINYWRDTRNLLKAGVAVDFKGIRFIVNNDDPSRVDVRLVGIRNEIDLGSSLSLAELESGKAQTLKFGPATLGVGVVFGTTDAKMELRYEPQTRSLSIPEASGSFEWTRLLYDPQRDSGTLKNLTGEVGSLPPGATILKPPPAAASKPKRSLSQSAR